MMIRCLAIDDEELSLELLEDNIRQIPFLELVGKASNASDAIRLLDENEVDLLFLDIRMPGMSGINLVRAIGSRVMTIFVTAYSNYAAESFELDVIDYLVKPYSFERFLQAASRAKEKQRLKGLNENTVQAAADFLFVYQEYNLVKIETAKIRYVEGLKDYVKIYIAEQTKPVITRLTIKSMEEKLPSNAFIRVHKSFIISKQYFTSMRRSRVKIGENEIPVSESYRDGLFRFIGITPPPSDSISKSEETD